jgi:hypothetical protein
MARTGFGFSPIEQCSRFHLASPFQLCPPIGGMKQQKTPTSGTHGAPSGWRLRTIIGQACKTTAAFQGIGLVSGICRVAGIVNRQNVAVER